MASSVFSSFPLGVNVNFCAIYVQKCVPCLNKVVNKIGSVFIQYIERAVFFKYCYKTATAITLLCNSYNTQHNYMIL